MKAKCSLRTLGLPALLLSTLIYQPTASFAQGTAFTYQGRLDSSGMPYTGSAEFQPTLWSAVVGGSPVATNNPAAVIVGVTNGVFTLPLEFGVAPFAGGVSRWLQLEVRTSLGPFSALSPRQPLTPAPYAIYASAANAAGLTGTLPAASLSGTYGSTLALNNAANVLAGNGSGLTSLNASQITTGTVADVRLSTNVALRSGGNTFSGNQIVSSGNVGIGTTIPTARLDVAGTANFSGNVGIGTTNPTSNLEVRSTTTATITATARGSVGQFIGQSANGTPEAPSAVVAGNELAWFGGRGHTGTAFSGGSRAAMIFSASENWNGAANGTDIAFSTTHNGSTSRAERMRITQDGSVGIGTQAPDGRLEVSSDANNADASVLSTAYGATPFFIGRKANGPASAPTAVRAGDPLVYFQGRGYTGTGFSGGGQASMTFSASENWANSANGTEITFSTTPNGTVLFAERMRIAENGNVGIGTTTPTKAKVEINGSFNFQTAAGYGHLTTTGAGANGAAGLFAYSLYANQNIAASAFVAFSDERIKRIEGRSDAARDLATLLGIKVTDYSYIDTVAKGPGKHKKVIAQQVEKVYPQAVTRSTDIVPDIYRKAEIKDGWVKLATSLKKGERVRLIGGKQEGIHEVLAVEPDRFRTAFAGDGDEVFVYGREVKDFRNVDYEAIAMLNLSATQEIHRKLEAKDAEFTKLGTELTNLRAEKTALAEKLAALEAREQAREARLSRLEKALDDRPALAANAGMRSILDIDK